MKIRMIKGLLILLLCGQLTFVLESCNGGKDATIKADLTTKAKSDKELTGVRFTVENGIVTLSGECPTEKTKNAVETKVKKLYGVKSVINNIEVGPVVIGTDELLKEGVDSILKNYAAVQAIVKDSVVELQGRVESKNSQKLIAEIEKLKPERIDNKLSLK
jgi:hyperosmotically inducible periplasmic protein